MREALVQVRLQGSESGPLARATSLSVHRKGLEELGLDLDQITAGVLSVRLGGTGDGVRVLVLEKAAKATAVPG